MQELPVYPSEVNALKHYLINIARKKKTVDYIHASRAADRFSAKMSELLGKLVAESVDNTGKIIRPILSTLVVTNGGLPGDGYFDYIEYLTGTKITDRRAFFEAQKQKAFEFYQENPLE